MTFRMKLGAVAALSLTVAWPALAQDQAAPAEGTAPEAPAAAAPAVQATADTVVATVNGTAITLGHMIALRAGLPAQYQQLDDRTLFDGILEQLIQQTALEQSVTPSRKDALTLENERRGYLAGVALQAAATAAVTDAALQAAYDAKYAQAEPGTEYNASHILVDSEEKARALKTQIDGGADFAELATANSGDPGSAQNGGELGWFGAGLMVPEFETAVVALEPGQVSDPVQTQFGWHIIRLNETRPATPPALDEVRGELAAEIERGALEAAIADIAGKATVTRSVEGIDPATLRDLTLIGE